MSLPSPRHVLSCLEPPKWSPCPYSCLLSAFSIQSWKIFLKQIPDHSSLGEFNSKTAQCPEDKKQPLHQWPTEPLQPVLRPASQALLYCSSPSLGHPDPVASLFFQQAGSLHLAALFLACCCSDISCFCPIVNILAQIISSSITPSLIYPVSYAIDLCLFSISPTKIESPLHARTLSALNTTVSQASHTLLATHYLLGKSSLKNELTDTLFPCCIIYLYLSKYFWVPMRRTAT